ncbi:MAG: histidine kinase, partial [Gammaproteobacteria bacterium]|nr:histidine kinase [Gammaproteobacteria bacterium]
MQKDILKVDVFDGEYDNRLFWLLHISGWMGISLVSYFSLNLWYNQPEITYLAHNVLQSVLGMIISWPLRQIFRAVWGISNFSRIAVIIVATLLLSALWSASRLSLFLLMTNESDLWSDFGGWLFSSIFIFGCWTAFYHGIKYYRLLQQETKNLQKLASAQKEEILKRTQAESAAQEAQLKLLRYQLNPHFLFNTLNAISSLVNSAESVRANDMIVQLSRFLRYSLDNGGVGEVPLSKEIEAVNLYLKIEQARFEDRLKVIFEISEEAQTSLVPSLLLQPLIENAIKYAIARSETGGVIRIAAAVERGSLSISVADSGADEEVVTVLAPQGVGVGLTNIRQRL